MKELKYLITQSKVKAKQGDLNRQISAIQIDSRQCKFGDLFVALKGTQVDGHQFIDQVIEKGVQAIICEVLPENLIEGVTYIRVSDSAKVLSEVSAAFYNYPSKKLKVVGITGTNGKTTTTTLLFDLYSKLGENVGLISTIS